MTSGTPPTAADPVPPATAAGGRSRRWLSWPVLLGVALALTLLVRALLVQSFYVPSGSMRPALEPGDRILVDKLAGAGGLHRGDVVVFDGTGTFAAASAPSRSAGLVGSALAAAASLLSVKLDEQDFVKRIVGMPGDTVACCDAQGRISVNGRPVVEDYLPPGTKPSELTFAVMVPAGHVWLMGDNRARSADSRAHLGDPGGGMVALHDVVGRAFAAYWPLDRLGGLGGGAALRSVPAASAGHR